MLRRLAELGSLLVNPPQAHISLSRFNLGLREPQRKLEGELGSDGEQVPGIVLLGHGRSIAAVRSAAWI